ncbi:hypothetical protein AC578_3284 [Pseudocercospora eumusae]|uniref:Uncharacterized protein n=1 Tax=Pseudocercospora eumusae TaxID=321146 RepID=A0A139HCG2_9PEZI|nr:hypothetical protein AC578_3284 [Pseudocercospora eumusae]
MDPSRRDPERSAGKIPINFLLAEDDTTSTTTTTQQQAFHHQQHRRDRSSQGSSTYPPNTASESRSSNIPGSSSSSSTTLPPLRVVNHSPSSTGTISASTIERGNPTQWHATTPDGSSILVDRKPRAPRPSYSEEQKFFIMYSRIIRDNTWPEIEDRFERLFGTRSKGGLTSVYYRVRREWGLMEVLKSGPGNYAADCREVEQRAMNFSREFLRQIGYLPQGS